jgi:hypothetical protein
LNALKRFWDFPAQFEAGMNLQSRKTETQLLLIGKTLGQLNRQRIPEILSNIKAAEFRVFSQGGDDGIIQFLVDYLDIPQRTFIEFGVENYTEANTRFLLQNNNWKGFIMDSSISHMDALRKEEIFWKFDLKAIPLHITKENINPTLKDSGFSGECGLLHIDIDGNDYWIWKEIEVISPVIVIMEYNSVFGFENPWTIPYMANFNRTEQHFSNLYWGSSLLSLCDLAKEKGYQFIGCNSLGVNAYFVRKDKIKELVPLTAEQGFVSSSYRESRNKDGSLSFISGMERLSQLKGLQIFNSRLGQNQVITIS